MAKKKNPLSDSPRKKRSYVGNLDKLMADISEGDNEPGDDDVPGEKEGSSPSGDDVPPHSSKQPPAVRDESYDPEPTHRETNSNEADREGGAKPKKPLNLKIDESLHTRFKGVVGMQGRTMTEVLEEFMRDYVQRSLKDLDL